MKLYQNKKWLYRKYIIEENSIVKIAKEIRCSPATIWNYLKKFRIEIRPKGTYERSEIWYKRKGKNHPMFGKKHSLETKRMMSFSKKGRIGIKSSRWKGDKASCSAKHKWIIRNLGKAKICIFNPNHIASRYNWANISGKYTRNLIDYAPMCPSCHLLFDRNQ
jgi:hypothetical protein